MPPVLQPKPKGHIPTFYLSVLGLHWGPVALRQAEGMGLGEREASTLLMTAL